MGHVFDHCFVFNSVFHCTDVCITSPVLTLIVWAWGSATFSALQSNVLCQYKIMKSVCERLYSRRSQNCRMVITTAWRAVKFWCQRNTRCHAEKSTMKQSRIEGGGCVKGKRANWQCSGQVVFSIWVAVNVLYLPLPQSPLRRSYYRARLVRAKQAYAIIVSSKSVNII